MPRRKRRIKRGTYLSTKMKVNYRYRSGWELLYMTHLDNDSNVEGFIYEPFAIPYVSNKRTGKVRRYFPDILVKFVDGKKQLVEIKPSRKVSKPTNVKKILAAGDWCRANGIEFVIVTEVQLKALGLLK